MTIFLGAALCLSLIVILGGFLMDRGGIVAKVNGANGLPLLAALILSFVGSLAVALIAGVFAGWAMLGRVLLFSVLYHPALGALLLWRLQVLATKVATVSKADSAG